jgi:predicted HicB family RNase H-like nuclease
MAVPFGFSVGDFIAGINLVKDVIKALQDSRGSSKEYLELIAELRSLETALFEVKTLDLRIEQRAKRAALREASKQCQTSIDNFLKDLMKYSTNLRLGGSLCAWKDAYRKIQWKLCKKDDLVRFREEIGFHVQSIQMLMLTIQMYDCFRKGQRIIIITSPTI